MKIWKEKEWAAQEQKEEATITARTEICRASPPHSNTEMVQMVLVLKHDGTKNKHFKLSNNPEISDISTVML